MDTRNEKNQYGKEKSPKDDPLNVSRCKVWFGSRSGDFRVIHFIGYLPYSRADSNKAHMFSGVTSGRML